MRGAGLQPVAAGATVFRDRGFKFLGGFVCSSTHNCQLWNADHRYQGGGVGLRRMRSTCHLRKLATSIRSAYKSKNSRDI
jgi:hypothetical protein